MIRMTLDRKEDSEHLQKLIFHYLNPLNNFAVVPGTTCDTLTNSN